MNTQRNAEIAKAVEVDTEVARLQGLYWETRSQVIRLEKELKRAEKDLARYIRIDLQIRVAEAQEEIAGLEKEIARLEKIADERHIAFVKFNDENYGGWARFFHVQHIHSNMNCSSFRPTTQIGWLPQLSGRTEAEAVAEQGEALCTICFPTAPVALTVKPAEEGVCSGSGKLYDKERLTGRERVYYSPSGTCPECGKVVALASRGSLKIRKHKVEA